jgi:hypothetical protein
MFLKLFQTLLGPLSLNGEQHRVLVIWNAVIIVNTVNQQNVQLYKVDISYTETEKNI